MLHFFAMVSFYHQGHQWHWGFAIRIIAFSVSIHFLFHLQQIQQESIIKSCVWSQKFWLFDFHFKIWIGLSYEPLYIMQGQQYSPPQSTSSSSWFLIPSKQVPKISKWQKSVFDWHRHNQGFCQLTLTAVS